MKSLALRIGLHRVAADLVGCALRAAVALRVTMPGWARDTPKGRPPRRRSAGWRSSPPAGSRPRKRSAVYGSTDDRPERHFLGWLDDVDPDELFASGAAYGLTVVRRAE